MAKSKKNSVISRQIHVSIILIVLVLVAVVAQLCFDRLVWHKVMQQDNRSLVQMIIASSEGLRTPTVVDSQSGKLFVPWARLTLPVPKSDFRTVTYLYAAPDGNFPGEVMLTTDQLVSPARNQLLNVASLYPNNTEELFKNVPELQACTRGVHVAFGVIDGNEAEKISDRKLADGRTVTFYKEPGCHADQTEFISYVQQIESY